MEVINETGLTVAVVPGEQTEAGFTALILIKGTFRLIPDGPCVPVAPDAQRPCEDDVLHQDTMGRSPAWVTDFAPFKPHTDCFVLGSAHAPGGTPVASFRAGFRVGPIVKGVKLLGPRTWLPSGQPSAPAPATAVPLRWELSSGGLQVAANPYGRGLDANEDGTVEVPQIEDAFNPVEHRSVPKPPVNLAPIPAWFDERRAKAGTRDQRWSLFRAPLPPKDYDPSIHNAAPADQQAGNYPRGDEPMTLVNLHPTVPTLSSALPGLRPHVVAIRPGGAGEMVTMRLDTVILLPDDDQVVLLWRGNPATADQAMTDIAVVVAGMEPLAEPPVPDAERIKSAKAKHAANQPKDTEAEVAQLEAESADEIRKILKDVDLPPALRTTVATETSATKLFSALATYLESELQKTGHWKP